VFDPQREKLVRFAMLCILAGLLSAMIGAGFAFLSDPNSLASSLGAAGMCTSLLLIVVGYFLLARIPQSESAG
jgi:hypothetical protein